MTLTLFLTLTVALALALSLTLSLTLVMAMAPTPTRARRYMKELNKNRSKAMIKFRRAMKRWKYFEMTPMSTPTTGRGGMNLRNLRRLSA